MFTTAGAFVRAFGKDVERAAVTSVTAASACEAGTSGGAAGQLQLPGRVCGRGGEVYVADTFNHRVSVFDVPSPQLSRAPATLAFGDQDVDDGATATQSSTVTNTGLTAVTLTGLALSGDTASFERLTGNAGDCTTTTELVPGDTCDVRLEFDPASTGAKAATLTVDSDAPDVTVGLSGTGIQTLLSSTPASHDFVSRDVDDGPSAAQSSTITNAGTESVTLTDLVLSGDAAHFERLTGQAGDCTTTTTLTAGQDCDVRFRFDPATTGAKAATLTVDSNAADVTADLSGTGIQTLLSPDPASVAFGSRDVDDGPSAAQSSTITNAGTESVTLTDLALSGDASQFERLTGQAGDCTTTTTLTAGQDCDVRFRFDPATAGAKAATLTVDSNAADVSVGLSGTGIQTLLSRDPVSLSFGSRDIDDGPTAEQSSTIGNAGTEPVMLSALTLSGDDSQFERLTGDVGDCTTSTVLSAGQTCTLRLHFDPTSTGAKRRR